MKRFLRWLFPPEPHMTLKDMPGYPNLSLLPEEWDELECLELPAMSDDLGDMGQAWASHYSLWRELAPQAQGGNGADREHQGMRRGTSSLLPWV